MPNFVAVDTVTHRRTRVLTAPSPRFGDTSQMVSVIPGEFPALIAHYPIFFRKSPESGRFEPGVLLGFSSGENLFVADDRWDAPYVPLEVQRKPFLIQPEGGDGGPRLVLTLDMDSPRVQEDEGEILFLETGARSSYLERVASILRALVDGGQAAYAYGAALAELELIEPVRLALEFIDGSTRDLEGLYSINPEALRRLSGAGLQSLQSAGWLELAYYQLGSLAHVQGLIARKNRLIAGGAAR
jgi:hypothetical protein